MKAKKKLKVRQSVSRGSMKAVHHVHPHHITLRSIVSLLSVLLAFSILMLFYTYKENIIASGSFTLFLGLSAFLLCMMLVLQYLVNPKK